MKNKKIIKIILHSLISFAYILAFSIICVCNFMITVFNVGVDSIIFTLTNPVKGANTDIIFQGIRYCLPRIAVFIILYVLILLYINRKNNHLVLQVQNIKTKKQSSINVTKISRKILSWFCIVSIIFSVFYTNKYYNFLDYLINQNSWSTVYENYYVDPDKANIVLNTEDGEKKNIIFIVMESMENTYTSKNNGGNLNNSVITNLETLANENISFSNSDKLGGFKQVFGSTWTIGSLLSLTSGINYKFPLDYNGMEFREKFADHLTTIGDILNDFGYNQMFLCGSDSDYGGRASYFKSHGYDEVFDYYSAIDAGYIAEDYHVWWGYEDKYLYQIAKDKLIDMSSQKEPFNLTMLTVDTHFSEGYVCDLCQNNYNSKTEKVISCADRQINEFIDWCKLQPFYEDTVIVISGDHERMDKHLVENASNRTMYNCFINSQITDTSNLKNRTFTTLDMFPTIMASLGYTWNGNMLGLGTNLFSGEKTLAEKITFETLNSELSKRSQYYIDNFY